jgi:hypothetical protein
MLKLVTDESRTLLRQPESGMGYQFVEAVTKDGQIKHGVVYNAELLSLDAEHNIDRLLMKQRTAAGMLNSAPSAAGQFRSIKVVGTRLVAESTRSAAKAGGAADAPRGRTNAGDAFYRFSAFENDHRVTPEGRLLPGSYATTKADGDKVKTGKEAVERYALPNDEPASYRFSIAPERGTAIQSGIVQPANGHKGGGVEVIFRDGTQDHTVALPPDHLPDE